MSSAQTPWLQLTPQKHISSTQTPSGFSSLAQHQLLFFQTTVCTLLLSHLLFWGFCQCRSHPMSGLQLIYIKELNSSIGKGPVCVCVCVCVCVVFFVCCSFCCVFSSVGHTLLSVHNPLVSSRPQKHMSSAQTPGSSRPQKHMSSAQTPWPQ